MTNLVARRIYSYADADRIAGVSRGTAKRWIEGYTRKTGDGERIDVPPVSPRRPQPGSGVSFEELIEIVVIGEFKKLGFTIRDVRAVVEACRDHFGLDHPLSEFQFKAGGRNVLVSKDGLLREVLRSKAQLAWDEVLGPFLSTLDYRDRRAYRWWPMGKERPVVIDPEYGFGLPVLAGTGVRTEIIWERVRAGDSPDEIADDFNVTHEQVDTAIQFEAQRAA